MASAPRGGYGVFKARAAFESVSDFRIGGCGLVTSVSAKRAKDTSVLTICLPTPTTQVPKPSEPCTFLPDHSLGCMQTPWDQDGCLYLYLDTSTTTCHVAYRAARSVPHAPAGAGSIEAPFADSRHRPRTPSASRGHEVRKSWRLMLISKRCCCNDRYEYAKGLRSWSGKL